MTLVGSAATVSELQLALLYYAILFFAMLYYRCRGAYTYPYSYPYSLSHIPIVVLSSNTILYNNQNSLFPQAFPNPLTKPQRAESVASKALIQPFIFFIFQTHFETVLKQKRIKIDSKPNQKSNIFWSFQIKNRSKNHTVAIRVYGLSAGAITP